MFFGEITAAASDDALETAVRDHARLVYSIAFSVLRNHHDAEDATQEVFLRVLRYERKLAGVQDRKTWLARIAWRVALDRRKKKPEVSLDDSQAGIAELVSRDIGAEGHIQNTEMAALLEAMMATLPDDLRHTLALSTVDEMTTSEVAKVVGISEAAVRSRLFRAREILREKLTSLLERKHGN